jgi:cytochrome c-type protein NapB
MTFIRLLACLILLAASNAALAAPPVKPDSMGLSPGSVFDVPAPPVYAIKGGPPGQDAVLPRAYPGAPPQIPHDIGDFLPITAQSNMCIACHNQPDNWGKKPEAGQPTPIPPSHYTDQRNAPGKVTDHLMGARYNCNICHVPQHDAKPLVENTFGAKRTRPVK